MTKKPLRITLFFGALLALCLYWYGAGVHSRRVNTDADRYDQSAYMEYAKKLHDTRYTYVGGRNRMPVYPFIMSLFYTPGMDDNAYFERGKKINTVLSLLVLLAVSVIFLKRFPLHDALNCLLIAAFSVFIFRAAYFQAEVLYYFLFLCVFLLLVHLYIAPNWKLAIAAGAVIGITHLTKASVLPALLLFVLFAGARECYLCYGRLRGAEKGLEQRLQTLRRTASIAVTVLVFLLVVFPYIRTSKRIFGAYFYNVNSTFYMWCDTVDEWKNGPKAHGDRVGWPDMPEDQIPSLKKYLREHTAGQIVRRIIEGHRIALRSCRWSYGYFKYVVLYFTFFLFLCAANLKKMLQVVREHFFTIGFVVTLFGAYFFVNGWYNYMVPQVRHILAFFLPFMFCVLYAGATVFAGTLPFTLAGKKGDARTVFNVVISCIIAVDIYLVLTGRLLAMQGGT